jgi:hypothetical protein
MSVLEKIRDKYAKTETVSDEYGRIIVVRRLNTSQRLAVREMANSGNPEVVVGASIVSIDDIVFPFPQNRKELNANLDVLDDPGLEALIKAYQKFNELSGQETIDAAKNLPGTPSFDSA